MFNQQPYNRGKFNVPSTRAVGNSGIALMVMGAKPISASRIISAMGSAVMQLDDVTVGTNVKYSNGIAGLIMDIYADGTKTFVASSDVSTLVMGTQASQVLSGEEVIVLEGLTLKPGDELVINTCDMTVTLNGQNAMQYFSNDSDFFALLSGINTIEYNDGSANRDIAFDIIWKDRWL